MILMQLWFLSVHVQQIKDGLNETNSFKNLSPMVVQVACKYYLFISLY